MKLYLKVLAQFAFKGADCSLYVAESQHRSGDVVLVNDSK